MPSESPSDRNGRRQKRRERSEPHLEAKQEHAQHETVAIPADVSAHVLTQTQPSGRDPILEEVEVATRTTLTVVRERRVVLIAGDSRGARKAKERLEKFFQSFFTATLHLSASQVAQSD